MRSNITVAMILGIKYIDESYRIEFTSYNKFSAIMNYLYTLDNVNVINITDLINSRTLHTDVLSYFLTNLQCLNYKIIVDVVDSYESTGSKFSILHNYCDIMTLAHRIAQIKKWSTKRMVKYDRDIFQREDNIWYKANKLLTGSSRQAELQGFINRLELNFESAANKKYYDEQLAGFEQLAIN
jgi:hypothetical protein